MKKRVTQVRISVIGNGRLGGAFAKAIKDSKHYELHSHLPARSKSFAELGKDGGADAIFIITKDDKIKTVAEQAAQSAGKNLRVMLHCAGSLSPDILPKIEGVERITLHPIQSIAEPKAKHLKGIAWMVCPDSDSSKRFAKELVKSWNCTEILHLQPLQLPLYHTITVFASNFTTLLGAAIEQMNRSLKLDKKQLKDALAPLMRSSLENVLADDAKNVLTGPIARKDFATILKHRIALKKEPIALRKIYEGFLMLAEGL